VPKKLTKTVARDIARQILSTGHFSVNAQEAYVRFHGERIGICGTMGRLPSHSKMVEQVAQGLLDMELDDPGSVTQWL
jgi:hypothetical protein